MVRTGLLGRIAIAIDADFAGFRREARGAGRSTEAMRRRFRRLQMQTRQAQRDIRRFQGALSRFGAIAGSAFAGFGIAEATRGFLAFDRELTKLNTLVGISRDQLNEWRVDIVDISNETGIAVEQLAEGLFNIASIGQRGTQAMETLRVIARATAVGLGDFATVADTITRIMGAYGTEMIEAAGATDAVFATVRLGNDLGQEFTRVIQEQVGAAANAGVSITDLGGALAYFTANGFRAQRVGVGLGQIFNSLVNPTTEGRMALQAVGLTLEQLQEQIREQGLVGTILTLNTALQEVGLEITNFFTRKDEVIVAQRVLEDYAGVLEYIRDLEVESVGAAERGFGGVSESAAQRITVALREIRNTLISIAEVVVPAFAEAFSDNIKEILEALSFLFGSLVAIPILRVVGGALNIVRVGIRRLRGSVANLNGSFKALGLESGTATGFLFGYRRSAILAELATKRFTRAQREAANAFLDLTEQNLRQLGVGLIKTGVTLAAVYGAGAASLARFRDVLEASSDSADELTKVYDRLAEAQRELNRIRLQEARGRFDAEREGELRQEIEALEDRERLIRQFGAEAADLTIQLREAEQELRALGEAGIDIGDLGVPRVRELTEAIVELQSKIVALTRDSTIEVETDFIASAIEDAEKRVEQAAADVAARTAVALDVRPSAVEPLLDGLRRSLETARLNLRLVNETQEARERETAILQFQRRVQEEVRRVEEERRATLRRVAEERARGEEADEDRLAEHQRLLGQLDQEEAALRDLLVPGSKRNQQVMELIDLQVRSNAETLRAQQIGRALESVDRASLARQNAILGAQQRARDFAEGIVGTARQEVRLLELAADLRARGFSESEIAGRTAVLAARLEIEERQAALSREIAEEDAKAQRARVAGNQAALDAATLRIDALTLELEATRDLSDEVRELGELRERIAELGEVQQGVATEFEDAYARMKDSVDDFVRSFIRGEADFERLVNAMLDHIFSLVSTEGLLKNFGGLLFSLFGGGLISGGAGAGSVNFGAPGFRHQGGQARGFTVVGEQGPELVDFRTPSRVYSNDDLAAAFGGAGGLVLNQNNVIESTDGPGVRRAIAAAMPEIVRQTVAVVTRHLGDRSSEMRGVLR